MSKGTICPGPAYETEQDKDEKPDSFAKIYAHQVKSLSVFSFLGFGYAHQAVVRSEIAHHSEHIVLRRSVFNFWNIFDTLMFRWLHYLGRSVETEGRPIKETILHEAGNVGLLAALLFTTWCNFLIAVTSNLQDNVGQTNLYVIFWTFAICTALISTCVCVFLIIAVSETSNEVETIHYLELLDSASLGFLGRHTAVFFIYLSAASALGGAILFLFQEYGTIYFAVIAVMSGLFSFCLWAYFMGNSTSSLHCARKTQDFISSLRFLKLSTSEIKQDFDEFVEISGGNIFDVGTEKEFIDFLTAKALIRQQSLGNADVYQYKLSPPLDIVARKFYSKVLEDVAEKVATDYVCEKAISSLRTIC
jgi:hypothetical protein